MRRAWYTSTRVAPKKNGRDVKENEIVRGWARERQRERERERDREYFIPFVKFSFVCYVARPGDVSPRMRYFPFTFSIELSLKTYSSRDIIFQLY
jgi:hypothetical protein